MLPFQSYISPISDSTFLTASSINALFHNQAKKKSFSHSVTLPDFFRPSQRHSFLDGGGEGQGARFVMAAPKSCGVFPRRRRSLVQFMEENVASRLKRVPLSRKSAIQLLGHFPPPLSTIRAGGGVEFDGNGKTLSSKVITVPFRPCLEVCVACLPLRELRKQQLTIHVMELIQQTGQLNGIR